MRGLLPGRLSGWVGDEALATCSMQRFGGGSEVSLLAAPPLSHLCHCHMTTFMSIEHMACSPAHPHENIHTCGYWVPGPRESHY